MSRLFAGKKGAFITFLLGILIGGGCFYLFIAYGNKSVENKSARPSITETDSIIIENNNYVYSFDSSALAIDTLPDSLFYMQIWNSLIAEPGYREMDSLFLDSIVKRIYADSILQIRRSSDDMYVQNEEMLSARYIIAPVFSATKDSSRWQQIATEKFYVEFWKSPVNFEGYVKNGKSLKLYSVQPAEGVSLVMLGAKVYLRRKAVWYFLVESTDDRSFVRVFDSATLQILSDLKY